MKITIIRDDKKAIGYTMTKETEEDAKTISIIRDLVFFGWDDTAIKYNGRISSSEDDDDVRTLSWIQKKYSKSGLSYEEAKALDVDFIKLYLNSL